MNYTKFLIIFYVVLALPVWAQKKPTPRQITKVVAGSVRQRNPVLSPRELLPQYRSFITLNGRCPRCSFYDGAFRLRNSQLTPQQLDEVQLANRVNNLLRRDLSEIPPQEQAQWQELQRLRKEYAPNRKTVHAQEVLAQTQEFIKIHGHRPRNIIKDADGNKIPLTQLTPQQHQECLLGIRISFLIHQFPKDPAVIELTQFVRQHPNVREVEGRSAQFVRNREVSLQLLLDETQAFVERYGIRPRVSRSKNEDEPFVSNPYAPNIEEEQQLALRIQAAFRWEKLSGQPNPVIQQLRELLTPYNHMSFNNSPLGVLPFLKKFVAQYYRLPRLVIYHNGKALKDNLTPQQKEERLLASRIEYILGKDYSFNKKQDQAFEEILQLWDAYHQLVPPGFVEQLSAWSAQHGNTSPHKEIQTYLGRTIPFERLTQDLQEEVLLGTKLNRILRKAQEMTPEIEALKRIHQLPLRELPPVKIQQMEDQLDDLEDYF